MNQNTTKTNEDRIFEEAFSSAPMEVADFISDPYFDLIIEAMEETIPLEKNQVSIVRTGACEIALGMKSMNQFAKECLEQNLFTSEVMAKTLYAIDQEILERVFTILEEKDIEDKEKESLLEEKAELGGTSTKLKTEQAPSPLQALNSIQERLTKPTIVTPITTRDYSINKSEQPTTTQTEMSPKPKIMDIYRELPEQ
jgi:hypothetical protein